MFKVVQVERAHAEASKQIATKIISGELKEGEFLPTEGELASHFGVSRVVVREALRSLAQRGLVDQSQGRRTVVRPQEDWDIFDVVVLTTMRQEGKIFPVLKDFTLIRLHLEPLIVAEAAQMESTEELVSRLKHHLQRMKELQNEHEGYYAADLDFHAQLAATTGNRVIYRLMRVIGALFHDVTPLPEAPYAEPQQAMADHSRLIAAIEAGNAEEAAAIMRNHLTWSLDGIKEMYGAGQRFLV